MLVNLPVELWLQVASYLPRDDLRRLYSVNRVFFSLEMQEKYMIVRFEKLEESLRHVRFLSCPIVSRHVRSLYLSPYPITESHTEHHAPKGILARIFRRAPQITSEKFAQQMAQAMHGLFGVTSLEVSWHWVGRDFTHFLSVVNAGWATFGTTLRRLILDVSLETFEYVVSASVVFPRLEALQATITNTYPLPTAAVVRERLATFINNHESTLSSLDLRVFSDHRLDVSRFLLSLRYLPHLTTLMLAHEFVDMQTSNDFGLEHILKLHAHQLRTFSLKLVPNLTRSYITPTIDEWYGQNFLQVRFTRLEVLDIGLNMFRDVHRTAIYLNRLQNPLTSLTLRRRDPKLSHHEVEVLINALAMPYHLTNLVLTVKLLTPQLLALLAAKLPALERLSLEYDHCRVDPGDWTSKVVTMYEFRAALKSYDYTGWKLRRLTIRPTSWHKVRYPQLREPTLWDALPGVIVNNEGVE